MVIEAVREWLIENNVPPMEDSMHANMMRRIGEKEKAAAVQQESITESETATKGHADFEDEDLALEMKRHAEGTPVNPESFAVWLAAFLADHPEESLEALDSSKGLTGKQMFMQHVQGTEDGFEEENAASEDEDEARKSALMVESEALFIDDGNDIDDDDIEFSDEDE